MNPVKVKVCGITRVEDISAAAHCGVDFLGFVFAASPRRLSLEAANLLMESVPEGIGKVGLFMNQGVEEIEHIIRNSYLDLLQFHGVEDNRFCRSFGLPFIKAIAMGGEPPAPHNVPDYPDAVGVLYDGHGHGEAGGGGQTFDWRRLNPGNTPLWLAGGLNPENVSQAIEQARPWAVDVSSGVEIAPGIKDHDKIRAFVAAVRDVSGDLNRKKDL